MLPRLLAATLPALATSATQDDFVREGDAERRELLEALEGKAPPPLHVGGWLNTERELALPELRGKLVVVEFWGVWCAPCRRAVPKLNELYARYRDQGLVLIGVHTTRDGDELAAGAQDLGIRYPVAVDRGGATDAAWLVDSYPDVYVIDRAGTLRVADLANADLERTVEALLAESAPGPERLQRVIDLAGSWRASRYDVFAGEERVGEALLVNTLVEIADGPDYFEFVDQAELAFGVEHHVLRTIVRCEIDELLTPTHVLADGQSGRQDLMADLRVEEGRWSGRIGGEEVLRELPVGVLTETTVLRMAAALPFEKGARLSFEGLELGRGRLDPGPGRTLEVAGWEDPPAEGGGPRTVRVDQLAGREVLARYWFDARRVLVRARLPSPVAGTLEWRLAEER